MILHELHLGREYYITTLSQNLQAAQVRFYLENSWTSSSLTCARQSSHLLTRALLELETTRMNADNNRIIGVAAEMVDGEGGEIAGSTRGFYSRANWHQSRSALFRGTLWPKRRILFRIQISRRPEPSLPLSTFTCRWCRVQRGLLPIRLRHRGLCATRAFLCHKGAGTPLLKQTNEQKKKRFSVSTTQRLSHAVYTGNVSTFRRQNLWAGKIFYFKEKSFVLHQIFFLMHAAKWCYSCLQREKEPPSTV